MNDDEFDAYGVLQIAPNAEDFILEAAYKAMARHFNPDGPTPNPARLADVTHAYDLLKTSERRKRYDRLHRTRPVGPGVPGTPAPRLNGDSPSPAAQALGGRVPGPTEGPAGLATSDPSMMTIDFGRYQGWTLKDLAKYDSDYLRFLSRHSSGVRYRNQIAQLIPDETAAAPSRRGKY